MIPRLQHWWQETRASFWFVPAVIVVASAELASCLFLLTEANCIYVAPWSGRSYALPGS